MTALAALAATALVSAVWQGLLLTVATAIVLRFIPNLPAAIRSAQWSVVFLLAIGLHFLPAGNAPAARHANPLWSVAVAALWLALSLYRACQLALGAMQLRALARRATPVEGRIPAGPFRSAVLCTSHEVDRPCVIGFFAPRILLPATLYANLTPAALTPILLHETSHLRRADDWMNLLQKLALVVFPLNPVLLWLERRLCRERELACDDRVLAATRAPKAYAQCLSSLAEYAARSRALSLALGAWQRQSDLVVRVHRILSQRPNPFSRRQTAAISAAILIGLAATAHRLAHSPQLLSFAPITIPVATSVMTSNAAVSLVSSTGARTILAGTTMPVAASGVSSVSAKVHPATLVRTTRHRAKQRRALLLQTAAAAQPPRPLQTRLAITFTQTSSRQPVRMCIQLRAEGLATLPCPYPPAPLPIAAYAVATPSGWILIQL